MFLSRCRLEEVVSTQVFAHEERIRTRDIAAHQPIGLRLSETNKGFQTGTKVVRAIAGTIGLVGHRQ